MTFLPFCQCIYRMIPVLYYILCLPVLVMQKLSMTAALLSYPFQGKRMTLLVCCPFRMAFLRLESKWQKALKAQLRKPLTSFKMWGTPYKDSLVLTNLTSSKDAVDQKYADSLTSISKEQEIHLEDQVRSSLCLGHNFYSDSKMRMPAICADLVCFEKMRLNPSRVSMNSLVSLEASTLLAYHYMPLQIGDP